MKNYKVNTSLGVVQLPFNLTSYYDDSMKGVNKTLTIEEALTMEMGEINDFEMTAFEFQFPQLIMDLHFHKEIDIKNNLDIRTMLSTPYTEYYDKVQDYFYDVAEPKGSILQYPTFWNSFGYPFYTQKESWYKTLPDGNPSATLLPKRFNSKLYLYNSFIKMNFYTTPYSTTQELLFQNVVYVNPRWCESEGDANGSWLRPTFKLNAETDGYYLYWLKKYNIKTFYVTFQFWDALNGRMINLLPSNLSTTSNQKKYWVQSVNQGFDSRDLYLAYNVNYQTQKYSIKGFRSTSEKWDEPLSTISLYELIFSDYFADKNPNVNILNDVPTVTVDPIIIPESQFDIRLGTLRLDITPQLDDDFGRIQYNEDMNFQVIRKFWETTASKTFTTYGGTNTIMNNGTESIYLKNIEVELINQGEIPNEQRLTGMRKNVNYINGLPITLYSMSSAPKYMMSQDNKLNELQKGFSKYYRAYGNDVGNSLAVQEVDDLNKPWYQSKAWMGWYYPLNASNFSSWGSSFSENLFISYKGNQLDEIKPNDTLDLTFNFGFGDKYGYSIVEPKFYDMCEYGGAYHVPEINYNIHLEYKVTLFFNDLRETLPVNANKVTFKVDSNFDLTYERGHDTNTNNDWGNE